MKRYDNIPTGTSVTGTSNAGEKVKKLQFSTNISLYLGNDTRYIQPSYYGMRIRNCTQAFEWCHIE